MYSKCKKELDQEIKNFIDESKKFKKLEIYVNSLLAKNNIFAHVLELNCHYMGSIPII